MKLVLRSLLFGIALVFAGLNTVYAGIADEASYIPDNTDFAVFINYEEVFSYLKTGGINPDDYLLMFGDVEAAQADEVLKRFGIKLSDIKEVFLSFCLAEMANQKFNFILMINTGGRGAIPEDLRTGAMKSEYGTIYTIPDSTNMLISYLKIDQYFIIGEKETLMAFLKRRSLKKGSAPVFHAKFIKGCRGRIIYGSIVLSEVVKQFVETAASAGAGANIDILKSNPFIKSLLAVESCDFALESGNGFAYSMGMYGVDGEDAERLVMISHFGIVSSSFLFTFADILMARSGGNLNPGVNAVFGDRETLNMVQQVLGRAKVTTTKDGVIVTLNETKEESDRSLAGIKKIIEKNRQARAERIESEKISVLTGAIIDNDDEAAEKALSVIRNVNIKDLNGDYPIGIAAMYGNVKMIKSLILKGAKIDSPSSNGNTPLHLAVSAGMLDAAAYLVEKGADINARNDEGMTPLYINASQGETGITQMLLRRGAQVNAFAGDGYAPIHRAAESGNLEVIKVLVQYKADVELVSSNQERAIDIASRNGFEDIVNYFKITFSQVPVEPSYDSENFDDYNYEEDGEYEGD